MVSKNEIIYMLTRMEQHITKQNATNKMLFKRMETLSPNLRRPMETTPTPSSILQPKILNLEISASSECQARDFISR